MIRYFSVSGLLATAFVLVFLCEGLCPNTAINISGQIPAFSNRAEAWIINRPYRISLQVRTQGYTNLDKPAEYQLNFTDYLHSFAISWAFDDKSLKVIEVDSKGSAVDTTLAFQFDKDPDYDPQNNASGLLIFTLKGTTNPNTTRYYQVYFDVAGKQYQLPQFSSSLGITDNVSRAGQSSFRVTANNNMQYYFQKQGAGFASIIDKDGKDWVNYNTSSQNEQYRGIPNLGSCGHPGYPLSTDPTTLGSISTIVSTGPLKIKIHSVTTDNKWEFTWEFFPNFARMSMLKIGGNYWFLYEGVPNGTMDLNSGYSVRNTHLRVPLSTSWTAGVLPSPKWVYFGDTKTKRVIFLAMHESDTHNDYYRPYLTTQDPTNMTVFGFGRQDPVQPNGKLLNLVPAHFTIGFVDDTTYSTVSGNVLSDISDLNITKTYDAPASAIPPAPVQVSPANNSSGLSTSIKFSWEGVPGADSYELQVSASSSFSTTLYDNSAIKDTSVQLNIFTDGTKYYWRVSSINSSGKSSFSSAYNFITALNSPDQLRAKFISPDKVQLNWVINSYAAPGYIVERKAGTGNYTILDTTGSNVTTYIDTTTNPGVLYYYRIRSVNQYAVSGYSNVAQIIYNAPPAPLPVQPADNSVNLPLTIKFTWNKSANTQNYQLQVSVSQSFSGTVFNDSTLSDTVKQISFTSDGTAYYWRLRSINSVGSSAYSTARMFVTLLNNPDSLKASFIVPDKIRLSWQNNSKSSPGIYIERKAAGGNYILIDSVSTGIGYTDSTALSGTVYSYRIRAFNKYEVSSYSNEVQSSYVTSVPDHGKIIKDYSLHQNYPNPFNPVTKIEYTIPVESRVRITIYDMMGREVELYNYATRQAGTYNIIFSAEALSSGIYFYSIEAEASDASKSYREIRKMMLLK